MEARGIPRVKRQGQLVPIVDVGTRYLGIRIDLLGDGGEQVAVLEARTSTRSKSASHVWNERRFTPVLKSPPTMISSPFSNQSLTRAPRSE